MRPYRFVLTSTAVFCAGASIAQFYGGDFDGRSALVVDNDAYVYDDFDVDGAGWTVTGIYANCFAFDEFITHMNWQIRSGISQGNGGTLVASGSGPITQIATGRNWFGVPEYELRISGLSTALPSGTYFVGVNVPVGGRVYVSTTSGANGFGSPLGNGNSWFDGKIYGANFDPTSMWLGKGIWDFSYGVVPEPASLPFLGVAVVLAARRWNKGR